jgi:16S rRNA (cytosine967-C5)-methyltransferase
VSSPTARGLGPAKNSVISTARKIAFRALQRVESENAHASEVLHAELTAEVSAADAALATELTLGVLRRRGLLDFLLERLLKKPVARLDLAVALALRIGLYQLRYLKRVPARAAVNESVEMVKKARKASAASLVNAVLRKAAGESATSPETLLRLELPLVTRLSILHSHPQWMVERWLARFGEERTTMLLDANNQAPRLSIALQQPAKRDATIRELEEAGLGVASGQVLKSALAVKGGSITRTNAFRNGRISIQDEASQAIPLLLKVQRGDRVLDLCAAPGGKTGALARAAGSGAFVVAADLHGHRLRAMDEQFARLGVRNILLAQLDATQPLPFAKKFDRILVDAPCSGTGTLARHPEIRWRLRPEQINEFHGLQATILSRATASLAPGGRLVYSTCSLEREENEDVIAEALEEDSSLQRASRDEMARTLEPHLSPSVSAAALVDDAGYFRTFPGEQRIDGFFAAMLEKSRYPVAGSQL